MRVSSRLSRVVSFGVVATVVSLSACSIFSGGDDSNGDSSSDDGGEGDVNNGTGKRDSGSARRDSGTDGGGSIEDSGVVTLPHDDAGHVLFSDGGAPVCDPQPLGGFSGGAYSPPVGPYAGACTSDDLTNYVSCATGSDSTQCDQFLASGGRAACGACLLTPASASHWGPSIGSTPPTSIINTAGCLALVFDEGSSSIGCGGRLQHAANCETAACDPNFNCAGYSTDDQNTCIQSAAAGECASYQNAAQSACEKDAGGADAVCNPTDVDGLASFLNVFCGSLP